MSRPSRVLTFIYLEKRELDFLRALQRTVQKATGHKRAPVLHEVIRSVIRDYRQVIEAGTNPDLVGVYEAACVRRRTLRRRATVGLTGVPRAGPTARP